MKPATKLIKNILLLSIITAIIGQELLYGAGIGVNWAILSALLATSVFCVSKASKEKPFANLNYFYSAIVVAAFGFAIRDSNGLDVFNLGLLLASVGFIVHWQRSPAGDRPGRWLWYTVTRWLALPFEGLVVPFLAKYKVSFISKGSLKGFLYAIPVLSIFGAILASADPAFSSAFSTSYEFDFDSIFGRAMTCLMIFAFCAGMLQHFPSVIATTVSGATSQFSVTYAQTYRVVSGVSIPVQGPSEKHAGYFPTEDSVTAATSFLKSIAALFLLFTLFQLRYLVQGVEQTLASTNMTYSEYARRGFFEIFTVAVLSVPILLGVQTRLSLTNQLQKDRLRTTFAAFGGLLLMLLGCATTRMSFYVSEFGLTTLRFFSLAGLLWVTMLIIGFLIYGLTWQVQKAVRFGFASLILVVGMMNLIAPDKLIASINVNHKSRDREFLLQLGSDALPVFKNNEIYSDWKRLQSQKPRTWKDTSWSESRL